MPRAYLHLPRPSVLLATYMAISGRQHTQLLELFVDEDLDVGQYTMFNSVITARAAGQLASRRALLHRELEHP